MCIGAEPINSIDGVYCIKKDKTVSFGICEICKNRMGNIPARMKKIAVDKCKSCGKL